MAKVVKSNTINGNNKSRIVIIKVASKGIKGKNTEGMNEDELGLSKTIRGTPVPKRKIIIKRKAPAKEVNATKVPTKTQVSEVDMATKREEAKKKVYNFLQAHKCTGKGQPFTHTTKEPTGSYYIDEDQTSNFMVLYCNAVSKGQTFALTEKPLEYGPLRVDLDLKAELSVGTERQYTEIIVKKIIGYYQDLIRNSVDEEYFHESMLWCILLEKSAPRIEASSGIIKDGFHLHFPFFIVSPWFQDVFLRETVTRKMSEDKIWEGTKYTEKPNKYIDTNMGRKPWLMYGSAKELKAEPFMFSKAYDHKLQLVPLEYVFQDLLANKKCSVTYYLPQFLSIRRDVEPTKLKLEVEQRILEQQSFRKKKVVVKTRKAEDILADIMLIKEGEIMEMLSNERADSYDTWMDVGWTLFCIGQGCEEALELWKKFSKRSLSYWEGVCEQRWDQMEMGGKTIGSLLYMAKKDDPERYEEWRNTNIRNCLYRSLLEEKPNEWDLSQVITSMYKYRFICSDSKNNIWYEFVNHRWRLLDDSMTLRKLFATEVVNEYYKLRASITKQDVESDEDNRAKNEKQLKRISKIITALKTLPFQEKLLKMCKIQFHDDKFEEKKDTNKFVIGCDNGVLDLKLCIFREGRPDDYCTKSCNLDFPTHYTTNTEEVMEVESIYEKIFVNPNIREFFWYVMSRALKRGNDLKIFLMHSGDGDNGKSLSFNFIGMALGEYYTALPREVLIKGPTVSANAPRPELLRAKGCCVTSIPELTKDEVISIGWLKVLSGNDKLPARTGYNFKMQDIICDFLSNYQCNDPPKIPGHDDTAWDRVLKIPYETRFVLPRKIKKYPVPLSEEEQRSMKRFHADTSLEHRLPNLAPALLWLLFHKYAENKDKNMQVPSEVRMATDEYRAMNDVYARFINEHVKPIDENDPEDTFLKVKQLRDDFSYWYQNEYETKGRTRTPLNIIAYEFGKKLGPVETKPKAGQGWYGFKIVYDEEEGTEETNQED